MLCPTQVVALQASSPTPLGPWRWRHQKARRGVDLASKRCRQSKHHAATVGRNGLQLLQRPVVFTVSASTPSDSYGKAEQERKSAISKPRRSGQMGAAAGSERPRAVQTNAEKQNLNVSPAVDEKLSSERSPSSNDVYPSDSNDNSISLNVTRNNSAGREAPVLRRERRYSSRRNVEPLRLDEQRGRLNRPQPARGDSGDMDNRRGGRKRVGNVRYQCV